MILRKEPPTVRDNGTHPKQHSLPPETRVGQHYLGLHYVDDEGVRLQSSNNHVSLHTLMAALLVLDDGFAHPTFA